MLKIENLHKTFTVERGKVEAVKGVNLELKDGEFFVLLGPSGSGKSTVMRCVAGLERPEEGEIVIGDRVVYSSKKNTWIPPHNRPVGMVFQSYAIWPHMTVAQNVSYPLEQGRNRVPRRQVKGFVEKALGRVKMTELAKRPAPLLSGGQQQRVALARALVTNPTIFLFDEPLSNLDAKLREEMRLELKRMTRNLGITTFYVTHDQLEALGMADRIGVIMDGRLLEVAPPAEIYLRAKTKRVAQFMGTANTFSGNVVKSDYPFGTIESEIGILEVTLFPGLKVGSEVEVIIRPEHIRCSEEHPPDGNAFEGIVEDSMFLGSYVNAHLKVKGKILQATLPGEESVMEGQNLWVNFPPERCVAVM